MEAHKQFPHVVPKSDDSSARKPSSQVVSPAPSTLSYRPDIDGLRAIAVLSVIVYHLSPKLLPGGFVGVDIFFVISGYLISRLLVTEYRRNGSIDLYAFYLRRARRILPALFVTLIASSAAAVYIMTPEKLTAFGGSLLHAVLSASNIFFFLESGYFDTDSHLKPLLHTWSLAVEEQFYLVWPLILGLVAARQIPTLGLIVSLSVVSLISSIIFISTHPNAVFFLTPFRVFEFGLGALIVTTSEGTRRQLTSDALLLLGLTLMGAALVLFSENTTFPGPSALIPCLGAALTICAAPDSRLRGILTNPIAVGFGLISYSLYLVHWPIIVFHQHITDLNFVPPERTMALFALTIMSALIMFFCVERPCRRRTSSNRRFLSILIFLAFALCFLGASFWVTRGWDWRPWFTNEMPPVVVEQGKQARFKIRQQYCSKKGWARCDDLVPNTINALIIGDSHAPDALNAFATIFPSHNLALSTLGGCPPHPNIESITTPAHPERAECIKLNQVRYNPAFLSKFDYVVINTMFSWYKPEFLSAYLLFLETHGVKKVIVFGGYLTTREDLSDLINKFGFDQAILSTYVQQPSFDDSSLREATEKLGYLYISKRDTFCPQGTCELFDKNNIPFTYDRHHLSFEFASRLGEANREAVSLYLGLRESK